jgi:sugar lactone lactonase YvrE
MTLEVFMRASLAFVLAVVLGAVMVVPVIAATVFPSQIALPVGFQPEGIAVGRGDTFYTGAIFTGAIYRGSLRTGEGAVLVPALPGRNALGMTVDNRNRLFVAGGFTGDAYVYDAATGAQLAYFDFASGNDTVINDVTLTKTGAWFTDSSRAVLYRVPIAPNGTLGGQADVQTLSLTGDFVLQPGFNLNGIVSTPNGDMLIVVQSNTGLLFTVDPATGVTKQVDLGGDTVLNGDGLVLQGKTLYVVQNADKQVTKIRLSPDFGSGAIVSQTTDPSFDFPTTAAAFGDSLYVVNARFGIADPDHSAFWITKIAKP